MPDYETVLIGFDERKNNKHFKREVVIDHTYQCYKYPLTGVYQVYETKHGKESK